MTSGVPVTEIALFRKALLSLAVLLLGLSTSCLTQTASPPPATKADLVLINGTVLTVDPKDSVAEALAIRGGKIIAVGSKQQILALTDAQTQVLDLHGRTATPGLINSYALRLAHINPETKDPPAGTIDRDATGAVTGVLKEQANVAMIAIIPPPSMDHRKQGILKSIDNLHHEGMTSIKEIGSPRTWTAYRELLAEGKLDERVCMLWRADNTLETAKAALAEIQKNPRPPQSLGDGRLVACGAKIFMDGSTAGRTAW